MKCFTFCISIIPHNLRSPRAPPGASRRTHFFLKIFIIPFDFCLNLDRLLVQKWDKIETNFSIERVNFSLKVNVKSRSLFFQKVTVYRPHTYGVPVGGFDPDFGYRTRSNPNSKSNDRFTLTSSPVQVRKYIWKWINFSVVIIVIITNTIIKKMI